MPCLDKGKAAGVLEPLDAVIRLHDPVVEGIAVGEQHVDVAVLVEVDQLEARRSPVRVWCRIDDFPFEREVSCALVDVGEHRLVLLREQRDEIHPAVAIEIDWHHLDAAGSRVDRVGDERRLCWIAGAVLQDRDLSGLAPSERRHREIDPAVVVEIGGVDTGDARPAVQPERSVLSFGETRIQMTAPLA